MPSMCSARRKEAVGATFGASRPTLANPLTADRVSFFYAHVISTRWVQPSNVFAALFENHRDD